MRATIQTITASGRTIPRLELVLDIENDKQEQIRILGYSIKLFVCNLYIGDISKFGITFLDQRGQFKIKEDFNISPFIFNSIEKERNFGDVPIYINATCLIIGRPDSTQEFNVENFNVEYINVSQFKLSQSDWAKIALDMGYTNYQIFEIPYSEVPDTSNFSKIMERLEEAQDHFNQGRNEEVVTSCRKAFESLQPLVTTKNSKTEMNSELARNIDMMCSESCQNRKSELIEEIRQRIWKVLHIGPHEGYNVTREDAEYILLLSFSTIRYFSKQLNKLSEK